MASEPANELVGLTTGTFLGDYFEKLCLWDKKISKFTRILSFCFIKHSNSSAYEFSKFVHKIRHVVKFVI